MLKTCIKLSLTTHYTADTRHQISLYFYTSVDRLNRLRHASCGKPIHSITNDWLVLPRQRPGAREPEESDVPHAAL